jgi:hypothetical protein
VNLISDNSVNAGHNSQMNNLLSINSNSIPYTHNAICLYILESILVIHYDIFIETF